MSAQIPLSELYRQTRSSFTAFVSARANSWDATVPATPGWTVHDVVAHVTGVAQDVACGEVPEAGPTPEWTAAHVARGRDIATADLLSAWAQASPAVEALLDRQPIWPVVLDAGSHELDVRAALADTGARHSALVVVGSKVLLHGLRVPAPLVVRTEHAVVRSGPAVDAAPGGPPVTLTTTAFEAFRWRLGRRSRRQLAAMDWDGDPTPFLDRLCVFGPAEDDLVE